MKRIILFMLIFFSTNSFAEYNWKKLGSNVNGNVYYIDTLSIKKNGSKVFYFLMNDYPRPNKFGDLSSRIYIEVNCLNLDYRFLKDFYYQEPMGNGEPVDIVNETGEWQVNVKDSIGEFSRKFACNYK